MKVILTIRFYQVVRLLTELGFWRLGIVLLGLALLLFSLFKWSLGLSEQENVSALFYLFGSVVLALLSLHLSRPDKTFLRKLGYSQYWIYALEYTILASPFLLCGLLTNAPVLSLLLLGAIGLLATAGYTLPFNGNAWLRTPSLQQPLRAIFSLLPVVAFEWRSGLRKHLPVVSILYILGVAVSYHFAVIPVVILLLSLISAGFYLECEPRNFLQLFALKHPALILKKCTNQLTIFWIGCLPLVAMQLVRYPQYMYLMLYLVVVSSILPLFSLMLKYTHYRPGEQLDRNQVLLGVALLGLVLPHFAPVPLIMTLFYYRKAQRNIASYLV